MAKRFAPLHKHTANTELINWGDPGDYRNRGAVRPRSSSKRLQAYYDSHDIPAASAQSAKVVAPATATASAAAPAAPKASASTKPVKSAAAIAAEQDNARINAVMGSSASTGKKKAASRLLLQTKASASEIISQLTTMEPDAAREAKEVEAMWKRATATANKIGGFADEHKAPENAGQFGWDKAIAKVNAMNGFSA